MKQKSIVLLLLICLISALVLPAAATEVPAVETPVTDFTPLDTTAPAEVFTGVPGSALLIELNSGVTLFAHNAAERRYPASLTKIMTALLALEHGNLDDQITVSETALENLHEDGSTVGLQAGEIISLKDLLYCIMVASANEACNVIAEYISGSVDAFVALMNEKAAELGCTGTHFANAHGLHDENHYTTAQDLALIVQAAMAYPEFREISNTPQYTVPATNISEERKLYSTNKLISTTTDTSGGNYYYSKAAGIKTGFTTPAQRCLISTATNDNLQFLGVILYAENAYNEETGSYDFRSFPEFINMCEYFFERYQYTTVLTTLYPVAEMPVNQSAGAQSVGGDDHAFSCEAVNLIVNLFGLLIIRNTVLVKRNIHTEQTVAQCLKLRRNDVGRLRVIYREGYQCRRHIDVLKGTGHTVLSADGRNTEAFLRVIST